MYALLKISHRLHTYSLSYYSNLIDHCLLFKSLNSAKSTHAQLIKLGFNTHTFLVNRCIDLYTKLGTLNDALKLFDEMPNKNIVSWNICLNAFGKSGDIERARGLFDEMPERDVVGWNSMISGYALNGFSELALGMFLEMQRVGVRPSVFTFSILVSCVWSGCCGKQIHANMMRNGVNSSNVVVGNSLIDMYGKLGLVEYAFVVFLSMEEVDVISWNSLISGCSKSGYEKLALNQFCLMKAAGYSPDEFTISTIITVCSNLQDLGKGKQIFALCVKLGFLSNTIVSSAAIDLFSKCDRWEDTVLIFQEVDVCDSAICNSMISSYARHDLEENALQTFMLALRRSVRPTEFTLSCVLSSASVFLPMEHGSQLHSLVVKLGFESDHVVSSSLVEMYSKYGLIDSAMNVFTQMDVRDLISWNTMIIGLTYNGKVNESLELFEELLESGPRPDQITLYGVLLACKYGGFVDEGMVIFKSMEKEYGVIPRDEHYGCIVDMVSQAGKLQEAISIVDTMPHEPNALIWGSVLHACAVHGELELTERVAEKMMELKPYASLPYLVLSHAYEMRGKWESLVRVRKAMNERCPKKVVGCSWIGIRNRVFVFKANQIFHHGSKDIYSILRLLIWEMEDEGFVLQQYSKVGAQRAEGEELYACGVVN